MFGGQAIYVDGVRVAGGNKATSDFNPSNPIVRMGFSQDGATDNFLGRMDDVAFLEQSLGAIEIGAISSLGSREELKYDLETVVELLDAFDDSQPVVSINGLTWVLIDDGSLTGPEGQVVMNNLNFAINLGGGNGFATFVPEPSSAALMPPVMAAAAGLRRRKRKLDLRRPKQPHVRL